MQATSTGTEVLKYVVAADSGYNKEKKQASFFRVASFIPEGPQRDMIANLDKGYVLFLCSTGPQLKHGGDWNPEKGEWSWVQE